MVDLDSFIAALGSVAAVATVIIMWLDMRKAYPSQQARRLDKMDDRLSAVEVDVAKDKAVVELIRLDISWIKKSADDTSERLGLLDRRINAIYERKYGD